MNRDRSYTLPEAAQTVARLKTVFHSPYTVKGVAPSGSFDDIPKGDPQALLSKFKVVPELEGREFASLTAMLAAFREIEPNGAWLFLLGGKTPGHKNPAGFVDTAILEKAISHHTTQGHKGEI